MVYTNTLLNTNIRGQSGYNKAQATFDMPGNNDLEQHKKNLDKFAWIFKG